MEHVALTDITPVGMGDGAERRELTDDLRTEHVAIVHYQLDPDEWLSGLHAHEDQEEVFVVLDGRARFETLDHSVSVAAGEAIRFAPGEFHAGRNQGADRLVLLALGSPRDTDDVRLPLSCPDCDHDDVRLETAHDGISFVCPECTTVRRPEPCPSCGSDELNVLPGDHHDVVVRCQGCAAEYEHPPVDGGW